MKDQLHQSLVKNQMLQPLTRDHYQPYTPPELTPTTPQSLELQEFDFLDSGVSTQNSYSGNLSDFSSRSGNHYSNSTNEVIKI